LLSIPRAPLNAISAKLNHYEADAELKLILSEHRAKMEGEARRMKRSGVR
jgi:hypothetical protein